MCSSATIALSARTCNGAGVCGAATSSPCGRYTCDTTAGACRTSCTTAATDCVAPNICNANICTLKPIGAACTTAGECDSNFCAQGYCCNQACNSPCKSCAIAGSLGDVQQRRQRHRALARDASASATVATSCGLDGMCNGAGACRFWASGTQCVAGTCVGSTLTPAAHLRRRRHLPIGHQRAVRSLPVRLGDRVQDDLHQHRDGLRVAQQLRRA